jgi:ABC-type transporter Mla subunit MlaD
LPRLVSKNDTTFRKTVRETLQKTRQGLKKHFPALNSALTSQKTLQHYKKQLKNRSKNNTPLRFSTQCLNNSKKLSVTIFSGYHSQSDMYLLPAQLKK